MAGIRISRWPRRAHQSRRTWPVLLAAATVVGGLAVGASPALAGSYQLSASGASFCSLGQFIANVPGFGTFCNDNSYSGVIAPSSGSAGGDRQLFQIASPSGALTITSADALGGYADLSDGYGGGTYWNSGGTSWYGGVTGLNEDSGSISTPYWGIQIECGDSKYCAEGADPEVLATGVDLTVSESSGPSLSAGGLWNETGAWVWNPAGDSWPLSVTSSDPSGVCSMYYSAQAGNIQTSPIQAQNTSVWQQCPDWTWNTSVDTTSYTATSAQLPLTIAAANTAGVQSSASEAIKVDNIQPTVSITPLNDANPGGWSVNHSVTLQVTPTAGPSGISSVTCADTVGGSTSPLTLTADPSVAGADEVTVDGNGSHAVSCSVANNAIDPQGAHNTGSAGETVDIDEQPPTLSFEAENPSNPDQVTVDTGDDESPVSGGGIEIAPQGSSSFTTLATTFTSRGQLTASIPDATLPAGTYTVQASATSQVGNSGQTSETVTLPLRASSTSIVSFAKIVDPLIAKKVKERVLVGFHLVSERKHGKTVKVAVGGHYKTITVIKRVERCRTKHVKVAKHKWKLKTVCAKPHLSYESKETVAYGNKTMVFGELTTSQGVAIASQTVEILTTPSNGSGQSTQIGTATTSADGGWSATVPAGPSRTIEGYYPGSPTILPTSADAQLSVPARLRLVISPTQLPWGKSIELSGRLEGGYVPAHGVAMRILIKIPGLKAPYVGPSFRTTPKGRFELSYIAPVIFHRPHVLAIAVGMVGAEDAYPFLATQSNWVKVEFGVKTAPHSAVKKTRSKTKQKQSG